MTRRLLLLLAILVALVPLKIAMMPGPGPYGLDASYYFQIARHVAEGDGLKTSVSLYHEGLDPLPAPAMIYPLWPLVLGAAGAWMGMTVAANGLPVALYFVNLLLIYLLANRIAMRMRGSPLLTQGAIPVDAGHVLVLLWATNRMFMSSTSHPYTEGLAFALAFGSMIAVDRTSWRTAAAAGALAGLAYLARSQMMVVPAATLPFLLCNAVRSRRARMALAYVAGLVTAVMPWFFYRAASAPGRADIGRFATWVDSASLGSYLTDRLPGLIVAFDPWSPLSYFRSFGAVAALVPLAGIVAAAGWWKRRPPLSSVCEERNLLIGAAALIALASHVILVHRHAQFFLPWLFGWRHGLPFIFAVIVAVVYLLTHRLSEMRIGVAAIVIITIASSVVHFVRGTDRAVLRPQPAEQELIAWTESLPSPPTMLTTHAQQLGMLTRARYHWTACGEPAAQTRRMLAQLPIEYIVVYEHETRCSFITGIPELKIAASFGPRGKRIFLLHRRRGDS